MRKNLTSTSSRSGEKFHRASQQTIQGRLDSFSVQAIFLLRAGARNAKFVALFLAVVD
jgi:hypothetical protein